MKTAILILLSLAAIVIGLCFITWAYQIVHGLAVVGTFIPLIIFEGSQYA